MGPPPPHPHREWAHPPRRHQDWAHPCDDFAGFLCAVHGEGRRGRGASRRHERDGPFRRARQVGLPRQDATTRILAPEDAVVCAASGASAKSSRAWKQAARARASGYCHSVHDTARDCAGSALLPHEHEQRQQRRPAGKSTTKARQCCPSITVGTATRSSTPPLPSQPRLCVCAALGHAAARAARRRASSTSTA